MEHLEGVEEARYHIEMLEHEIDLEETAKQLDSEGVQDNKECEELKGSENNHFAHHRQLDEKTCTMRISDATTEDNAEWTCLVYKGNTYVEARINVNVYTPTKLAFQSRPLKTFSAGDAAFSNFN